MTASPISDLNPLFLAAGAMLEVTSKGKKQFTKNLCLKVKFTYLEITYWKHLVISYTLFCCNYS